MARQLNIRSDEAFETAKRLAERHGITTTEVVVRALRKFDGGKLATPEDKLTPAQKAEVEALRQLGRNAAKHAKPGATSDHSDMYDENGLPV